MKQFNEKAKACRPELVSKRFRNAVRLLGKLDAKGVSADAAAPPQRTSVYIRRMLCPAGVPTAAPTKLGIYLWMNPSAH